MSAIQSEIPFKSRKRVLLSKKENDENLCDNKPITKLRSLKRPLQDGVVSENSEEERSCNKISRRGSETKNEPNSTHNTDLNIPLPTREKEIEEIEKFLTEQLEKEESATMYISGQPGTGKTACLKHIMQSPQIKQGYKQVYVNCTMMKSASSIYHRICTELQLKTSGSSEKACLGAIESYLMKKHKMMLVVLDEMDQLYSRRQSVLYTVWEWGRAGSRAVVVGVANALDLTQRALPRLQGRAPRALHFAPYDKAQIAHVLANTLARHSHFSPVALQMLAAKVAAISGDMRRALDIGRRVIELSKRHKFSETQCVDTMLEDSSVNVELKQVLEVLNVVYGGSRKIEADVDEGFPMQQKLLLCSLMLMLTKGKNKDIVMGKLYDVYKRVAAARNIAPVSAGEAWAACALLEAGGALRVGAGGSGPARTRRLRLLWNEEELAAALRDKALLAAILDDVDCLHPKAR